MKPGVDHGTAAKPDPVAAALGRISDLIIRGRPVALIRTDVHATLFGRRLEPDGAELTAAFREQLDQAVAAAVEEAQYADPESLVQLQNARAIVTALKAARDAAAFPED